MKLKPGAHIHLMGICGTAMASLAGMLKERGFHITGSDQNVYPPMSTQLENLGIEIMQGYRAENLKCKPDYVIVGNVMTRDYEESQALLQSNIPYSSLPKTIGDLIIEERESYVVCGTHGKTTTTAMLSWIAQNLDLQPGYMIGGIPLNFSKSFQLPKANTFIIEGDEYDTAFFDKVPKFIHYKPKYVVLSSVEFDHADIYKDLDAVISAFKMLDSSMDKDGLLVYRAGDKNIDKVVSGIQAVKKVSYDFSSGDYQVEGLSYKPEATYFSVTYMGDKIGEFELPQYGSYNVLNALACIAMAHQQAWDIKKVVAAFKSFKGVKRRQELIGTPNSISVIEDFAHHPTAVKLTVEAVKQRFAKQKVFAVFEPRSATSRRKVFQKQYEEAFAKADEIWIREAFNQSSILEENRFSSHELVENLRNSGLNANWFEDVDVLVEQLKLDAKPGDAILLMSNGSFDGIYSKLLTSLDV